MADQPQLAPIEVYLTVGDGDAASRFYQAAFGAAETYRQTADDGKRLLHCNLSMFGGQIMLSDEFPEHTTDVAAPPTQGGASVTVHINLATAGDVDRAMTTAEKTGAHIAMPAADMYWRAHYGRLMDPFGHSWSFGAPIANKNA